MYYENARKCAILNLDRKSIDRKIKDCYIHEVSYHYLLQKKFEEVIKIYEEDLYIFNTKDELCYVCNTLGDCYSICVFLFCLFLQDNFIEAERYYDYAIKNTKNDCLKKEIYKKLCFCYLHEVYFHFF